MFLPSKLPARFVAAKMSITTRLRPRAQDPYGQRKGSVSRTRKEANFGDRGFFSGDSSTWKDAIELQMPYQEAFDEIKENTGALENRWAKQCVIRMVKAQFDSLKPTAVPNQQEGSPGASISAESGGGEQPEPDQEDDPESRDNRKKRQFNNKKNVPFLTSK
ncbi:hypothetical protein CpipJ_CPIJ020228 [Culex quinquefasciatus]|uniref:Uncharacterized protein n=1 Tax=Culex quinquefasciatus TaxID=7176 RepID=B0XL89_CULQU|nr:hypothetical protein CpipJ_CPIJ020228 [Culex quinquefasciatus]|eukprot:XP_001870411.1 hypothetical protein CpipJ_CPIJ020228 [Culex quinquefasciatus]